MPGPSGPGSKTGVHGRGCGLFQGRLNVPNLNAYSPVMRITLWILTLALLTGHTLAADFRVGIVGDGLPGQDPQVTQAILHALEPVAAAPRVIRPDELIGPESLKDIDLLVLPSARSIPRRFVPAIGHFLNGGGRLMACGLPLGTLGVFKAGDKWMTR